VAILHSYESRWAIEWQRHNSNFDPVAEIISYYRPLRAISQSIDIVAPMVPLDGYKLVVAPGLNVLPDGMATHLAEYVQEGGHLVLGPRTGMKNSDNALHLQRQPGPLAELLGGRVEQYYALADPVPVEGRWGTRESKLWAELLSVRESDVEILERYGKSNGWLDNQPAAITRKVGKGRITYIGAWLDDGGMAAAARWMAEVSAVNPALGLVPDGVEVSPRYGPGKIVYVLVNFSGSNQIVSLPGEMSDLLEGGTTRRISLPQYGVGVLVDRLK
jgi:beta-galactosidase